MSKSIPNPRKFQKSPAYVSANEAKRSNMIQRVGIVVALIVGGLGIFSSCRDHSFDVESRNRDVPDIRVEPIESSSLPSGSLPQFMIRNPGTRGTDIAAIRYMGKVLPVTVPGSTKITLDSGGAEMLSIFPCSLARVSNISNSNENNREFTIMTGTIDGEEDVPIDDEILSRIRRERESLNRTEGKCSNNTDYDITPEQIDTLNEIFSGRYVVGELPEWATAP